MKALKLFGVVGIFVVIGNFGNVAGADTQSWATSQGATQDSGLTRDAAAFAGSIVSGKQPTAPPIVMQGMSMVMSEGAGSAGACPTANLGAVKGSGFLEGTGVAGAGSLCVVVVFWAPLQAAVVVPTTVPVVTTTAPAVAPTTVPVVTTTVPVVVPTTIAASTLQTAAVSKLPVAVLGENKISSAVPMATLRNAPMGTPTKGGKGLVYFSGGLLSLLGVGAYLKVRHNA